MKHLTVLLALVLTACSSGGGNAGGTTSTATPVVTPGIVAPVAPVVPTAVSITYYSVSHTVNAVPFTASCTMYNSFSYCWDDGVKAVPTALHYSYWQVIPGGHCGGNCTADPLANTPTLVTANVLTYMVNALFSTTPSSLIGSGTPTTVSCTLSTSNVIDCTSFTIDLNQVPM